MAGLFKKGAERKTTKRLTSTKEEVELVVILKIKVGEIVSQNELDDISHFFVIFC